MVSLNRRLVIVSQINYSNKKKMNYWSTKKNVLEQRNFITPRTSQQTAARVFAIHGSLSFPPTFGFTDKIFSILQNFFLRLHTILVVETIKQYTPSNQQTHHSSNRVQWYTAWLPQKRERVYNTWHHRTDKNRC
jgi:hypothetical protein